MKPPHYYEQKAERASLFFCLAGVLALASAIAVLIFALNHLPYWFIGAAVAAVLCGFIATVQHRDCMRYHGRAATETTHRSREGC